MPITWYQLVYNGYTEYLDNSESGYINKNYVQFVIAVDKNYLYLDDKLNIKSKIVLSDGSCLYSTDHATRIWEKLNHNR